MGWWFELTEKLRACGLKHFERQKKNFVDSSGQIPGSLELILLSKQGMGISELWLQFGGVDSLNRISDTNHCLVGKWVTTWRRCRFLLWRNRLDIIGS